MIQQLTLFDTGEPSLSSGMEGLKRVDLGRGAWIDHAPSLLGGHERLYRHLMRSTTWHSDTRVMYEAEVAVPRLMAGLPADGPGHPVLNELSETLSQRYGRHLRRMQVNWYRTGQDSVAPHGDRLGEHKHDSVVAILSVGAPRPFVLKPVASADLVGTQHEEPEDAPALHTRKLHLGWGDLLVLGGTIQATWTHGVPKIDASEGRISVMFREL